MKSAQRHCIVLVAAVVAMLAVPPERAEAQVGYCSECEWTWYGEYGCDACRLLVPLGWSDCQQLNCYECRLHLYGCGNIAMAGEALLKSLIELGGSGAGEVEPTVLWAQAGESRTPTGHPEFLSPCLLFAELHRSVIAHDLWNGLWYS